MLGTLVILTQPSRYRAWKRGLGAGNCGKPAGRGYLHRTGIQYGDCSAARQKQAILCIAFAEG